MVSDGVADSSDDKWLQDLLAGWQGDDPNVLVSLVLRECRQRRHGDDDCSALCLCLPPQNRGKTTGEGRINRPLPGNNGKGNPYFSGQKGAVPLGERYLPPA